MTRVATTTRTVAPGFGAAGVAYVDCSPRIRVTAEAPECDYSLFCVWVPYPDPGAPGGWRWALKSVHGRCEAHKTLLRSKAR